MPGETQLQYTLLDSERGTHKTDKKTLSTHAGPDLELVLLAVDDDSSNLLVHKDEDGAEQGRKCCHKQRPPWISSKWVY